MSLKAFHIFFIVAASAVSAGCAGWAFKTYGTPDESRPWQLWFGIGGALIAAGLLIYLRSFLKKMKHVSYL
jgi:hypothetical protein